MLETYLWRCNQKRYNLELYNFKLSNRISLYLPTFWITDFRTFNFSSSFQVHIFSLWHVKLEGKCFKIVPNRSVINLWSLSVYCKYFSMHFFLNGYNRKFMVKIFIFPFFSCGLWIIEDEYNFLLKTCSYLFCIIFLAHRKM